MEDASKRLKLLIPADYSTIDYDFSIVIFPLM